MAPPLRAARGAREPGARRNPSSRQRRVRAAASPPAVPAVPAALGHLTGVGVSASVVA